jgi:tetratricopeptide (TPR) repeat protein
MDPHQILEKAAQHQAARGNYTSALDLLDQNSSPEAARLRGQIRCQQGRFSESAGHWKEALAANPNDEEAKRGLALAESLAHSPLGRVRLRARRYALIVAILVGLASLAAWYAVTPGGPSNRELAESLQRLERKVADGNASARENADTLARRLDGALGSATRAQQQTQEQLQRAQRALRRVEKAVAEPARH